MRLESKLSVVVTASLLLLIVALIPLQIWAQGSVCPPGLQNVLGLPADICFDAVGVQLIEAAGPTPTVINTDIFQSGSDVTFAIWLKTEPHEHGYPVGGRFFRQTGGSGQTEHIYPGLVTVLTVPGGTGNWALGQVDPPPVAVQSVAITGPTTVNANNPQSFTVTYQPVTASVPVTISWFVTDVGNLTDTLDTFVNTVGRNLSWPTTGTKVIAVSAYNQHNPGIPGGALVPHAALTVTVQEALTILYLPVILKSSGTQQPPDLVCPSGTFSDLRWPAGTVCVDETGLQRAQGLPKGQYRGGISPMKIWISPTKVQFHGFDNSVTLWPVTSGVGECHPIGLNIVRTVVLTTASNVADPIWGLGNATGTPCSLPSTP